MRIVFDLSVSRMTHTAAAPVSSAKGRREQVLVVRLERTAAAEAVASSGTGDDGPSQAGANGSKSSGVPGVDLFWQTSDAALARDQSMRGHEAQHLSVLGPYAASAIQYQTRLGAEGEPLAVGGRIAVDLTAVPGDPEATLRKARTILHAASAPGDPSTADQRVAAKAYRLMQQAQAELRVDQLA